MLKIPKSNFKLGPKLMWYDPVKMTKISKWRKVAKNFEKHFLVWAPDFRNANGGCEGPLFTVHRKYMYFQMDLRINYSSKRETEKLDYQKNFGRPNKWPLGSENGHFLPKTSSFCQKWQFFNQKIFCFKINFKTF